jgi:hypothetical protein
MRVTPAGVARPPVGVVMPLRGCTRGRSRSVTSAQPGLLFALKSPRSVRGALTGSQRPAGLASDGLAVQHEDPLRARRGHNARPVERDVRRPARRGVRRGTRDFYVECRRTMSRFRVAGVTPVARVQSLLTQRTSTGARSRSSKSTATASGPRHRIRSRRGLVHTCYSYIHSSCPSVLKLGLGAGPRDVISRGVPIINPWHVPGHLGDIA